MSSILPLGRDYNATCSVTTAVKRVSLRDCSGVGFLIVNASAATTATISESTAASGGTRQTLAGTFSYWTMASGAGVWTAGAGGVNGTSITTIAAVGALLYVFIPMGALSDGFSYLDCSHATGTSVYLLGELNVQRKVLNLRDVTA